MHLSTLPMNLDVDRFWKQFTEVERTYRSMKLQRISGWMDHKYDKTAAEKIKLYRLNIQIKPRATNIAPFDIKKRFLM